MPFASTLEMAERGSSQEHSLGNASSPTIDQSAPTVVGDEAGQENDRFNVEDFYRKDCTWRDARYGQPLPPNGWPLIASIQERFPNMDFVRTFNPVARRLYFHYGNEVRLIDKELQAYDREHAEHLRGFPNDAANCVGVQGSSSSQYQQLIERLNQSLSKYRSALSYLIEMQKLSPVPVEHHYTLMKLVEKKNMLQKDGAGYFDAPEDFSTFHPLPHSWVTRVLHSSVAQRIMGNLKVVCAGPCEDSWALPNPEVIIITVTHVLGIVFFLLGPIGVMMLAHLNNGQVYGVIVGFTLVFSAFFSKMNAYDTQKTFIAACGYLAVMGAFAMTFWIE